MTYEADESDLYAAVTNETRKKYLESSTPLNVSRIDSLPFMSLLSEAAEHQGIELRCCDWLPLRRPGRTNRYGFTFYGNGMFPIVLVSKAVFADLQRFRNTLLQEIVHAFSQAVAENDEPPEDGESAEYALGEIRAIYGASSIAAMNGLLTIATLHGNSTTAFHWEVTLERLGVSENLIEASREKGLSRADIIMKGLSP